MDEIQKYNKFLSIHHKSNEYMEWVSDDWRFSIHNDEGKLFWIFVHRNIDDSDSAYFTDNQLEWLKDLLE